MNYTPYGFVPYIEQDATALAFNGDHLDKPTQQYLLGNGHRGFSPAIMRFCSPDLQSPFLQGGVNCYCYCSGDPINFKDPKGQNRTLLMLLNSNLPTRHSGNPRPAQSQALLQGARSSYEAAQNARRLANEAFRLMKQFKRRAANSHRLSEVTQDYVSWAQHSLAEVQFTRQALRHLSVWRQQRKVERRELRNQHRQNSEHRDLMKHHKENLPPLATDAPPPQNVTTENTLPLEAQDVRQ